jgi:NADH:ubiquinone oxidoreductase subunit
MQGAQNLRSEAYLAVRRNDEGEAQRRRWTFYGAINVDSEIPPEGNFHLPHDYSLFHVVESS